MLPPRVDLEAVKRSIGEYSDSVQPLAQRADIYRDLLGFVPPRIEARLNVTGALDPHMLDLQERIRAHGMYPRSFDVKTAQLMLFGMLLMDLSDAAQLHALAARRADASWPELQQPIAAPKSSPMSPNASRMWHSDLNPTRPRRQSDRATAGWDVRWPEALLRRRSVYVDFFRYPENARIAVTVFCETR